MPKFLSVAEGMRLKRSGMIHAGEVAKLLGVKVETITRYVIETQLSPKNFPQPDYRNGTRNLWWKKERIDNYLKEKKCKSHIHE